MRSAGIFSYDIRKASAHLAWLPSMMVDMEKRLRDRFRDQSSEFVILSSQLEDFDKLIFSVELRNED